MEGGVNAAAFERVNTTFDKYKKQLAGQYRQAGVPEGNANAEVQRVITEKVRLMYPENDPKRIELQKINKDQTKQMTTLGQIVGTPPPTPKPAAPPAATPAAQGPVAPGPTPAATPAPAPGAPPAPKKP
jgi:hypothetical protein